MAPLNQASKRIEAQPAIAQARITDLQIRIEDLEKAVVENDKRARAGARGAPTFGKPESRAGAPAARGGIPRLPDLPAAATAGFRAILALIPVAGPAAANLVGAIVRNPELAGAIINAGLDKIPGIDKIPGLVTSILTVVNTVQSLQSAQEAARLTADQTFSGIKAAVTLGGDDTDFSDIGSFIKDSFKINQARILLARKQRQAALTLFAETALEIVGGIGGS